MIRLIIVDDEDETREGLRDFIPWKDLGIDIIDVASDGFEALELANATKPDIIITDVRMTRMDGITFATKIKEALPKCKIIFISGYSDKEYLKSAIKLKAISYVEKPINFDEIKSAVQDAVKVHMDEENDRATKENSIIVMSQAGHLIRQEIALELIDSNLNMEAILEKLNATNIHFTSSNKYCTVIIKFNTRDYSLDSNIVTGRIIESIDAAISSLFENYLIANKGNAYIIIHLCDDNVAEKELLRSSLQQFMKQLSKDIQGITEIFISAGKCVIGLENIRESYQTSVIAVQQLFFIGYNRVTIYEESLNMPFSFDNTLLSVFGKCLKESNKNEATYFIKKTAADIRNHRNTIIDYVKNVFYNLVLQLSNIAHERGIEGKEDPQDDLDFLWKLISEKDTLNEIENYLIERINVFFLSLEEMSSKNNPVFLITQYIQTHFSNENLSIKEIADSIHLTPAYICQVFKKETGKTVNQYVTEYRLEKAKEFLKDKQAKLVEVASKSGYSDANYFTRIFKKSFGFTPSEYREKYHL